MGQTFFLNCISYLSYIVNMNFSDVITDSNVGAAAVPSTVIKGHAPLRHHRGCRHLSNNSHYLQHRAHHNEDIRICSILSVWFYLSWPVGVNYSNNTQRERGVCMLPPFHYSGSTDPGDHHRPHWQTKRGGLVTTGHRTHSHCYPQRSAGISGPVKIGIQRGKTYFS